VHPDELTTRSDGVSKKKHADNRKILFISVLEVEARTEILDGDIVIEPTPKK